MLTSDNRASRLIGPKGACPNVTQLSGNYCILCWKKIFLRLSLGLINSDGNFSVNHGNAKFIKISHLPVLIGCRATRDFLLSCTP